ncbi:N-acetylglucosamine kinase [Aureimonas endophytica]|uniref:N-acetylglucosamine kinase n=1 Tax=Aureimonas endophytica TaxID=2027858 RepID=A0A916ZIA5_9HYPH|nr:ROK family protein [Aureimonas endophytica]GGD99298.1 N-acetylglucosamine kinase [Aureimonas endophytica]
MASPPIVLPEAYRPKAVPAGGVAGVCADIGGSFIKASRLAADGALQPEIRVPTPAADWPGFCEALGALCAGLPAGVPLSLSIAGVFDPRSGIAKVANIPCIDGRRLGADLEAALGRPVAIANDADCFVLAEALLGAGAGHPVVFGVILGTGVGGGLVAGGRIVEGAGGVAGEWGHGPVIRPAAPGAPPAPAFACGCGQTGCIDTVGSARGLERLDLFLHGEARDSRVIVESWQAGEATAGAVVALWLDLLSGPLAMIVNATGASAVPVAGGLANSAELLALLDGAVRRGILRRMDQPLVTATQLGPNAGLLGAALRLGSTAG